MDKDHSTAPTRDLVRRSDVCSSAAASGSSVVPAGAPPTCSRANMGTPRWSVVCLGLLQVPKVPSLALSCTFIIACPPWQEPCQAEVEVLLDLGAAFLAMTEQRGFVSMNSVQQTARTVLMELAQDPWRVWIRSSTQIGMVCLRAVKVLINSSSDGGDLADIKKSVWWKRAKSFMPVQAELTGCCTWLSLHFWQILVRLHGKACRVRPK